MGLNNYALHNPHSHARTWVVVIFLAILGHILLLVTSPKFAVPVKPQRIEIQTLSPEQLEQIQKKWRAQDSKQLLLGKNEPKPKTAEPPPNARYESDRNQRVEREQRAKRTTVIPKLKSAPPAPPKVEDTVENPTARTLPNLGNLGVPLRLEQRKKTAQESSISQEESGDQALSDNSLPEGDQNILNTQESVFYSFYSRLYEAVGPIWQSSIKSVRPANRIVPGEYMTVVEVVLTRDGDLKEIVFLKRSGVREFDEVVNHSWKKIARFPNPPAGLRDSEGNVRTRWSFSIQVNSSFEFDYLPPERRE